MDEFPDNLEINLSASEAIKYRLCLKLSRSIRLKTRQRDRSFSWWLSKVGYCVWFASCLALSLLTKRMETKQKHSGRSDLCPLFVSLRSLPGNLKRVLSALVENRRIGAGVEQGFRSGDAALVHPAMERRAPLPVLRVQVGSASSRIVSALSPSAASCSGVRRALFNASTWTPRASSFSVHAFDPARAAQCSGVIP